MSDANALKDQGNKAFAAKDYDKATQLFSKAIELDPQNHVLWSNRSAAKAGNKLWPDALEDAEQTIKLNPTWSKGFARKGAALHGARRYSQAIAAYEAGLAIEPNAAPLQKGLKEVKDAQENEEMATGDGSIGKMFSDPGLFAKLAANPKTASLLADRDFMQKLQLMQQNPRLAQQVAFQDPRMIQVLGVLMGIDMQGFAREEGSNDLPEGIVPMDTSPPSSPPRPTPKPTPTTSFTAPPPSKSAPPPDTKMEEPEEEEEDDDAKAKKEAEEEKKKGNEAYKARNFDEAEKHFEKAWEIWPKDITFLTNLAAVYFEKGDYDKTISTCETAVDEGRSLRADYKLIAKSLGRIGSAYSKKGDLANAVKFFSKSLTEHRTPDILNKLREAEKQKTEADKQAYIDPELSHQSREEGNKLFKDGKFAESIKAYTESIKRDPSDARGYNNRAAAYTKLVALPEALKDAEEAIKIDRKFVKAYLRKSNILFSMKEFPKAVEAAQQASDADEKKEHTREIETQLAKAANAVYSQREGETDEDTLNRAMRDPEVAQIMNDPVMQQILQQSQQNPAALQDHMKNPVVRAKIQKLIAAGIIRTR